MRHNRGYDDDAAEDGVSRQSFPKHDPNPQWREWTFKGVDQCSFSRGQKSGANLKEAEAQCHLHQPKAAKSTI